VFLRRYLALCALALSFVVSLAVVAPAEAAAKISITLRCTSTPERTTIRNLSTKTVTIKTIGSLYNPRSSEPFTVNYVLGAGKAVTFQSGPNTTGHTLTHLTIYNDTNSAEGVRVTTNVGTFTKKCSSTGSSGGSGGSASGSGATGGSGGSASSGSASSGSGG
jgi:hypothetical protein